VRICWRRPTPELGSPDLAASALAVAGPVSGDGTTVTVINTGLAFDQMAARSVLGTSTRFVNDFYAQAASIPYLQDLQQMGGDAAANGVRAILGPGSGLGMASLVPKHLVPTGSDGWMVLPSEGGHGDLAPGSFLEAELWSVLAQEHGQVSWETALSGPGNSASVSGHEQYLGHIARAANLRRGRSLRVWHQIPCAIKP
jgi:glucokinase